MTVFLDLDGVMANFQDAVCAVHGVQTPYLDSANHGSYDMYKLMGMTAKQIEAPLTFKFWSRLEKMDDADLILAFAKSLGTVYFLSAPVDTNGCRDGKHVWVKRNYPQHRLILCDAEAKHAVAHPGAWLIDDRDDNVKRFRRGLGKAVLVPRPWNSLHKHCWDDDTVLKSMRIQVRMTCEGKL